MFFPESYPEYLISVFLAKGQKWLRYWCFCTQKVAFRDFNEEDCSLYEEDRNLYEVYRSLYEVDTQISSIFLSSS